MVFRYVPRQSPESVRMTIFFHHFEMVESHMPTKGTRAVRGKGVVIRFAGSLRQ